MKSNPNQLYVKLVNGVFNSHLSIVGKWIKDDVLHRLFLELNDYPKITKRTFNTRMFSICSANKRVYENKVYCHEIKPYIKWYLFILSDRLIPQPEIVKLHTEYVSDMYSSDRMGSNSNESDSSTPTKTTIPMVNNDTIDCPIQFSSKWFSPEATQFFLPHNFVNLKQKGNNETVSDQKNKILKILHTHASTFRKAWLRFDGWRSVISDNDADNFLSASDIFEVTMRCKYLFFAMKMLIDHYKKISIIACFQLAIDQVNEYEDFNEINDEDSPTGKINHPKTVLRLYNMYKYSCSFQNNKKYSNGKIVLPTLLTSNLDVKDAVISYCHKNLSTLSGEMLHEYLMHKCIPTLFKKQRLELNDSIC